MSTLSMLKRGLVCAALVAAAAPTVCAGDAIVNRSIAYRNGAKPGSPCVIRLNSDLKDGRIEFWKVKGSVLRTLSGHGDGFSVIPDPKLNNNHVMTITYKPGMISDPVITLELSGGSLKAPFEFKCKLGKKITMEPLKDKSLKVNSRGYYENDDFSVNSVSVEGDPLIVFK